MKVFAPLFFLFFLTFSFADAQNIYPINGQERELDVIVEGPLTLLWYKDGREQRFFSKRDNDIVELTNTQENGKYLEEYKDVLTRHTFNTISTADVKLNLRSLNNFFVKYNEQVEKTEKGKMESRMGIFAGVDNMIFTTNPTNVWHPKVGIEYEIFESTLPRHSGVLMGQYTFKSNEHRYQSLQLSLNYRFKFVQSRRFDSYVNAKFFAFTTSKFEYLIAVEDSEVPAYIYDKKSTSGVSAPFLFGLGADYRVGSGFITLGLLDLVGVNVKSNKEFPLNLTLGYKFEL